MKALERRHDLDLKQDRTQSNSSGTLLELLTDFGDDVQNLTEEVKKNKEYNINDRGTHCKNNTSSSQLQALYSFELCTFYFFAFYNKTM